MMSDLWLSEDSLIAQYNLFESAGEKEKLLEIILPIYKKGFFFPDNDHRMKTRFDCVCQLNFENMMNVEMAGKHVDYDLYNLKYFPLK